MRSNRPYHVLLALLGFCALLMFASLFSTGEKQQNIPPFPYAPGYYMDFPRIGRARVIPYTIHVLQSSAVSDI